MLSTQFCSNIFSLMYIKLLAGRKMHRTPKNIYILNLGISGISTSLLCIPPTLMQCLYGGKWYLGLTACKLVPALQGTNTLVARIDWHGCKQGKTVRAANPPT